MTKKIIIAASLLVLLLIPASASAHVSDEHGNANSTLRERIKEHKEVIEEKRKEREEQLDALHAKRCEFTKTRLEAHLDRVSVIREQRNQRIEKFMNKLRNIASRLEGQDIDVTELEEDIEKLSDLLDETNTAFDVYEDAIAEAITSVCDDTDTVKQLVHSARDQMKELRSHANEQKEFLVNEVRQTLNDIKKALQEAKAEANDSQEEED